MFKTMTAAAALFAAAVCGPAFASENAAPAAEHHAAGTAGPTAEEGLARLMEGNQRFVKGASVHPGATPERRAGLAGGQKPFAAVLACSDSRVPPEILFDQGLGDIFTVRVAGNVAALPEQGSLEYAAEHLGVPVLMVLGHTGCGAAKAAAAGGRTEGALGALLKELEPAVRSAKASGAKGESLAPEVVEANVRLTALKLMKNNAIVRRLSAEGRLKVSAAVYDLATGEVRLLDLEKDLRAERKAQVAAMRGLLRKFRDSGLDDLERSRLLSGLGELLPELN